MKTTGMRILMSSFLFSICTYCNKYYLYHSTYQLKNCNYNLKSNSFVPAQRHAPFTPMWMYKEIQELKTIHEDYFMQLKNIINKYGIEE